MKITALKVQIKNPERVSVFVDEAYSFSLSLGELVKHKIKNGDDLAETDVKRFKKISADGKLAARALEWLMNRPHSTREFRDYMYRKKADPELADKLVKDFSQKKYLDDGHYARWLVDLRARAGKSNRAISAELMAKGIDREVATEVLNGADGEEQRLKLVIAKKKNLSRYKNNPMKFKQYLASQGFSYDMIKKYLTS